MDSAGIVFRLWAVFALQDTPIKGVRLEDLVEVAKSGALEKKKAGRPKDVANTTLSIALVHKKTGKQYHRCVAERCTWVRAGVAQRSRLLKHSTSCIYLALVRSSP